MSKELVELQKQLKVKNESISALEKDLNEANFAMESSTIARKSNTLMLDPLKNSTDPQRHSMQSSSETQNNKSSSSSSSASSSFPSTMDSDNAILHAIQTQRDRYMKVAKENEQEVLLLKSRLDRYVYYSSLFA